MTSVVAIQKKDIYMSDSYDYDFIVIGSGFDGSVL